jgi:hypothetical protein
MGDFGINYYYYYYYFNFVNFFEKIKLHPFVNYFKNLDCRNLEIEPVAQVQISILGVNTLTTRTIRELQN